MTAAYHAVSFNDTRCSNLSWAVYPGARESISDPEIAELSEKLRVGATPQAFDVAWKVAKKDSPKCARPCLAAQSRAASGSMRRQPTGDAARERLPAAADVSRAACLPLHRLPVTWPQASAGTGLTGTTFAPLSLQFRAFQKRQTSLMRLRGSLTEVRVSDPINDTSYCQS